MRLDRNRARGVVRSHTGKEIPFEFPHVAVIGAEIGEVVGSLNGLGNLLLTANSQLDSPLAWAALVWLSVLGIVLFAAVVAIERLVMPWSEAGHH